MKFTGLDGQEYITRSVASDPATWEVPGWDLQRLATVMVTESGDHAVSIGRLMVCPVLGNSPEASVRTHGTRPVGVRLIWDGELIAEFG